MANGKKGDHPYTDIVHHRLDMYSPLAAALVREISILADDRTRRELANLLANNSKLQLNPDIPGLEKLLSEMRDRLRREARERGFESE